MAQNNVIHRIFFGVRLFPETTIPVDPDNWLWSSTDVKMSSETNKMSGSSQ